jgi:hypothetical protein
MKNIGITEGGIVFKKSCIFATNNIILVKRLKTYEKEDLGKAAHKY